VRVLPHAPISRSLNFDLWTLTQFQSCGSKSKDQRPKLVFLRKGSLTGKAVVPKTTAHLSLAGSSPVPSANRWRRRLMVWQRFAKSPRNACAGSTPAASAKVSAVRSSDSTGGCQRSSLTAGRIRGPVAQGNESATLRRSRSHVQIVPGPPNQRMKDEG
jgi:hypothetical protein